MFSINGMPLRSGGPTRIGIPLVDLGTGLYAAIAVLMALLERARSGEGQFIDMTLYDAGIALMHPHIPNYVLCGQAAGADRQRAPEHLPLRQVPDARPSTCSSRSATTARSGGCAPSSARPSWPTTRAFAPTATGSATAPS